MILANFVFAQPWWLAAIPLALALAFLAGRAGLTTAITYSSLSILASLARKAKKRPFGVHPTFLLFAVLCGIIACARPQILKSYDTSKNDGIDIVVALDLSYSMTIDDFYPNDDRSKRPITRLVASKEVLRTFISRRPSDRIGIVAFSGRPYNLSPITLDHSWLYDRLDVAKSGIEGGTIKEQGTAIGSAIAASSSRLTARDAKSKVIILITDGASNTGKLDPVEASEFAAQLDIKIYTIAIGTEEGRVAGTIQRFPKQEFDVPTLKKIASTTGGEFYRARSVSDLKNTFKTINQLEKTEVEVTSTVIADEYFTWFAGAAALLALASLAYRVLLPVAVP